MRTLVSVLFALVSTLLPFTGAFAQQDQFPPTAIIVQEDFDFTPIRYNWLPSAGQWTFANSTYGNNTAASKSLTTITDYREVDPTAPGDDRIHFAEFFMRARMRNQGTSDAHLVGIVYGFQDVLNYYEAVVSATGTVRLRTVMNGVAVDEGPAIHVNIPRNTWFELEARWNRGVASLKVNGVPVFTDVSQPEFTSGQIGLVTYAAVGRFDKVFLGTPIGDQDFLETFSDPSTVFTPESGQWSVVNGTYRNSAVQQTSITLAPIHAGLHQGTFEFTFRVRMLNPYANAGNTIGVVFNRHIGSYTEIVFSPTGVATLNRFENGATHTVATTNYGGRRNVPFEFKMENGPNHILFTVDGQPIFPDINIFDVNPDQFSDGGVGLITHWAPGRFDNVQFNQGFSVACSFTFDTPPPDFWTVSGTWNGDGGTLNDVSAGQTDILRLPCDAGENANAVYSARLLNQYGASGNLVGLIYDFQDVDDYHEIVFSPTGTMQLNRLMQGVRYPVATRTHNIPANTWFDVQVIRTGVLTDVKLNGVTLLEQLPQGDLRGGSIGAITHWAKARFDNLLLTPREVRPPSEL
jgi:hypothetical protein